MPPKPKVSKAEKERLKREEEERKAKEEEEKRQREEKERLEREEKERLEAEERARLLALEEARFSKEKEKALNYTEYQNNQLSDWKKECLRKKKWDHYISCSNLPDPSDERSLNTFINTFAATPANHVRIDLILERVSSCLKLCEELEALLHGDGYTLPSEEDAARYKEVLHSLPLLIQTKLDHMTLAFLKDAERHTDTETHNLNVESSISRLSYCLWGNVIKDPRLKNFGFKERSFVLELPKPLLLQDVALRLLYPPYDTLSPQSRSFAPNVSLVLQDNVAGGKDTNVPTSGDIQPTAAQGKVEGVGENSIPGQEKVSSGPSQEEGSSGVTNGDNSIAIKVPEASGTDASTTPQQPIAPQEVSTHAASTTTPLEVDEVDLRAFRPARGPIVIELLELPASAKVVKNWTIKKVHSDLTAFVYPAELGHSRNNQQDGAAPPPVPGSSSWPPIGISMKLPDRFVFTTKPQMAYWDKNSKLWRTSGIQDIVFNMEERQVSLQTYYFAPLALMVDVHLNMPYRSWLLLPKGPDTTLISVAGAAIEVAIEIKGDICCLSQTSEATQLSHLINKPMTARMLIKELREAGANFFPEADAHLYVHDIAKVMNDEQPVYQQMALLASVYGFRHSRWNKLAGKDSIILQSCECIHEEGPERLSWSLYVIGGKRCFKLQMSEESSELSLNMQTGCETHADLFSTLESTASQEALNMMKKASPQHIDTVSQWMAATKFLDFS